MSESSLTTRVSVYLGCRNEVERLEGMLKRAKEEMNQAEQECLEDWAGEDIKSMKIAGVNVHKQRELSVNVKAENREAVVEACRMLGYDDLVKETTEVSTTSLKARIREWMGEEGSVDEVPEQLREVVGIYDRQVLRVRKA